MREGVLTAASADGASVTEDIPHTDTQNVTYIGRVYRDYGTYIGIAVVTLIVAYYFFGGDNQIVIDENAALILGLALFGLIMVYYWEKHKPKHHLYQQLEDDILFFIKNRYGRDSPLLNIRPDNNRVYPLDFPSLCYFIFHYLDTGLNLLYGRTEGVIGILNFRGDPSKAGHDVLETELSRYMGREAAHKLMERKALVDMLNNEQQIT